jgi:hypothetical protein
MKSFFRIKRVPVFLFLFVCVVLLAACAHSVDVKACMNGQPEPHGFWGGLWHGIIAPVDFVVMLFNKNITLYAPNNNGAWYAFGFLLGSGGWGFLGGRGSSRKKH